MKKIALAAAMLPVLSCADASGESRYGSSFDQKAFLPEISLIVDASYVHRNIEDAERESFTLYGIGYSDFAEFNADNGFNLNYAELALSSTVDQAFDLEGVFHFSPEGVEIEEAYFTTRQLPWSLRLKGGKFRSDFGRLNAQHQHIWDFADAPLVYSAFLSSEGLNSTGVQLQWLVPVSWYMMAGIELMQSMEEGSFSNQSFETDTSSVAAGTEPALVIGYWKNSFDIRETTVLIGVSAAKGTSKNEEAAFDGETKLYGADLLVKSYFDSYSYLSWQSEWLYRDSDGTQVDSGKRLQLRQSGAYSQLVYAYDRNWRTGFRYDGLFHDERNGITDNSNRDRVTVMAEYNPSEFSRLRVQYSHDDAFEDADGKRQDIDTVIFEVNFAIGAHGAHSF